MVGFVIPAHNEEALIGGTIRAIHEAARAALSAGRGYGVFVADDASTDRTAAVAASLGAHVIPIAA